MDGRANAARQGEAAAGGDPSRPGRAGLEVRHVHAEAALLRIENKTYGICTETGDFISKERLMALPEATTCLNA